MHRKIKAIRVQLGLSEAQISSLLNISCYKYKRYENGSLSLSLDILVLLSIIYDISIDWLILDKFSVEVICKDEAIKKILKVPQKERINILVSNMSKHCTFDCNTINYRVTKNILAGLLNRFSKNIKNMRNSQLLEISEISLIIHSDVEYYVNLENGKEWPSVYDLLQLSSIFLKSINELVGIEDEV